MGSGRGRCLESSTMSFPRFLKEGATPLVRSSSANPLTVALEEIGSGKVRSAGPPEVAPPPIETALPIERASEPEIGTNGDGE